MIQLLVALLLLAALLVLIARFRRLSAAERRNLLLRSALGALLVLLIMLLVTGRMHWIGALIGAILPLFKGALMIGLQLLPFWQARRRQGGEQQASSASTSALSTQEALDILGLKGSLTQGDITRDMVIEAHRRLIQKLHPDRGGNDYLAAKLNDAKALLLRQLG